MRPIRLAVLLIVAVSCSSEADPIGLRGITVKPTALDFGDVSLGTSTKRSVRVDNVGDAPLDIAIQPSADLDPAFFFSAPTRRIEPKASSGFDVTFEPRRDGDAAGALFVAVVDDDRPPVQITLTGQGFEAPLFVEETEIDLPLTLLGTTRRHIVPLRNVSNTPIEVTVIPQRNVAACPSTAQLFCFDAPAPTAIPAQSTAELAVEFTPDVAGVPESSIFLLRACDGEGCDVTITVRGEATDLGVDCTPGRVDFGDVNVGSCVTQNIECTNLVNTEARVERVALAPGSSSAFTPDTQTPATIAGDGTWSLPVEYCPLGAATNRGTVEIDVAEADAPIRRISVFVEGSGGGPDVEVTPQAIEVGEVSVLAPVEVGFTIFNRGTGVLEVSEIVLDPEGTGAASSPDLAPATLGPAESKIVRVQVLPQVAGPVMFTAVVHTNDRDTPEAVVTFRAEGLQLGPCRYEMRPSTLDLGAVARGMPQRRAIVVRNIGSDDCLFRNFAVSADAAPNLRLVGAPTSARVAAGDDLAFDLEYWSLTTESRGAQLTFSVSDPSEPNPSRTVTAEAQDTRPLLYPDALDFGPASNACAARVQTVNIHNITAQPIRVSNVRFSGQDSGAFAFAGNSFPIMISNGRTGSFDVRFQPSRTTPGAYAATLIVDVVINGVSETLRSSLFGRVTNEPRRVDRFAPTSSDEVDILLVYEHTFNTRQARTPFTDALDTVFSRANTAGLDFRAAVTTGDMTMERGAFLGSVVDGRTTPSAAEVLRTATVARRESGFNGIGSTLFESTLAAATVPSIDGNSAGLLRRDARLQVVMLARNTEVSSWSVDQTVEILQRLKGYSRRHLVSVTTVAGDLPSGCNPGTGFVPAAPRYGQVADRTGGEKLSYCTTDWASTVASIAPSLLGARSVYELADLPDPTTLEVRVDGTVLPPSTSAGEQWVYDATTNVVRFTTIGRPALGATVEVAYARACP